MDRSWFFGIWGLILGSGCSAQETATFLPDSLVPARHFHFFIENDSLYQNLEVIHFGPKSIWYDLAVCIKDATWAEDTLRANGILSWSGTYGPVSEDDNGTMRMQPSEWCYSGDQLEICLYEHDAREATVTWLAPSSTRMRRK